MSDVQLVSCLLVLYSEEFEQINDAVYDDGDDVDVDNVFSTGC